jgi:hypothetical protein
MAIEIKQQKEDQFSVNHKAVYKNSDGEWIAREELSVNEIRAFQQHIQTI